MKQFFCEKVSIRTMIKPYNNNKNVYANVETKWDELVKARWAFSIHSIETRVVLFSGQVHLKVKLDMINISHYIARMLNEPLQ